MNDETPADTLRDRIIAALYGSRRNGLGGMTEADAVAHMAAAVLAALPDARPATPAICEIPHATVDEEDACERRRLGGVEAHPPSSRWAVETYDPLAEQWAPGSRYPSRADAVERYLGISGSHPAWRDGTPVQRRIVRETTTHTVEPTP